MYVKKEDSKNRLEKLSKVYSVEITIVAWVVNQEYFTRLPTST